MEGFKYVFDVLYYDAQTEIKMVKYWFDSIEDAKQFAAILDIFIEMHDNRDEEYFDKHREVDEEYYASNASIHYFLEEGYPRYKEHILAIEEHGRKFPNFHDFAVEMCEGCGVMTTKMDTTLAKFKRLGHIFMMTRVYSYDVNLCKNIKDQIKQ